MLHPQAPTQENKCEECGHRIRHENWHAHSHYALHPNSELNLLMKGYLKQLGGRRQGKLNDKIQAEIKEEYEKQKKVINTQPFKRTISK